ncbi:hypothetical protein HPP92_021702 [Vanilla planifolia]|uniref:Uncharacterized protein n=1 Tax=Vanilla planifolia TaxID=51239 RepID=A0A835PW20_VANPL|nr:hypothetical protein HPP92_021702 [Vanilla planifolia]
MAKFSAFLAAFFAVLLLLAVSDAGRTLVADEIAPAPEVEFSGPALGPLPDFNDPESDYYFSPGPVAEEWGQSSSVEPEI